MSAPSPDLSPAALVRIEAAALEQLAARLDGAQRNVFEQVAALLAEANRAGARIVLTGVGKSGLIARKIASTMISTGTSACFLHPAEALHGDLGMVRRGDVVVALSYSGETEELLRLLPVLPKLGLTLVSFSGCADSTLAHASLYVLDVSVGQEACQHQLAPTASTTAMLALGDALAVDISRRLGFQAAEFAELHPGGQLGRRLTPVRQLMHTGDAVPSVPPDAAISQIVHEMSAKRLGMTTVQENGHLLGVLSDGDLRRLLERDGPNAFRTRADQAMNRSPRTIGPAPFAPDALELMERFRITSLVVTEDGTAATPVLGVLHMHDLWTIAPAATLPERKLAR
ncbi:MAG TPA: KpsF/GutQ family sugar-phosphate isomerase [Acidobacteriaceae bacterium]|jgi:arabinose-5-phosphate isomerase|nr:KpsF/GutQ family sugar-phosphate isomerase [Acidobacteriaceae bacterium]